MEPDLFFSGDGLALEAAHYTHQQSPAQRIGQWLSMHFIEPYFAFFDQDFALQTVLARASHGHSELGNTGLPTCASSRCTMRQRNAWLWDKVFKDPQYRALTRKIWLEEFGHLSRRSDARADAQGGKRADRTDRQGAGATALPRRQGSVRAVAERWPPYLAYEDRLYPRARLAGTAWTRRARRAFTSRTTGAAAWL